MKLKFNNKCSYEKCKLFYHFLFIFLNATVCVDIMRMAFDMYLPNALDYIEIIRNVIYIIPAIYVFIIVATRPIKKQLFGYLGVILSTLVVSIIINTWIVEYLFNDILISISRVLIGFFYFYYAKDYEKISGFQTKMFLPMIVYMLLLSQLGINENYMGYSYNLLPLAVFFTLYGYCKSKIVMTICGMSAMFEILLLGSRGALVAGFVAIGGYLIMASKNNIKKYSIMMAAFITAIIGLLNLDEILSFLLNKYGQSRTLIILSRGMLFDGGGRNIRQEAILDHLSFLPHGLFSDRAEISNALGMSINSAFYPHNIFLELLYQFGYVIGFVLSIYIVYVLFRGIAYTIKNDTEIYANILFFSYAITFAFKMLISSSYLIDYSAGIFIALCIRFSKQYRRGKR